MSFFDSIIGTAGEKFGINNEKAGGLMSALLGLITSGGGLNGFLDRFRAAGLGETANSWVTTGSNAPLSGEQVESALGEDTIASVAGKAGVDNSTARSAMAAMIPQVVDRLTPNGEIPDQAGLLSTLGGYLGGAGGAVAGGIGAAGAAASGAFDRIGNATESAAGRSKEYLGGIGGASGGIGNVGGAVGDRVSGTLNNVGDRLGDDEGGGSVLRWLLPLLLLGVLVVLGFWFCSKAPVAPAGSANANTNRANTTANTTANTAAAKTVDSSLKIDAKDGKYVVSGVVADEAAKKQIVDAMTAQYGAGNVDFSGLTVNAAAKPFAAGWWDNFSKLLPNLKDWKTGSLAFAGGAITTASGLPQAALAQIKSLFAGWTLPVSIAGAEGATKQANEEALKELGEADSIDEVVKALNVSIINFASGKSDIPADAQSVLAKASEVLKKQPAGTNIEIGGYTDNKGNAAANKTLSQSRADAVKKALVGLGVSDAMLKSVGYGDANPVGDNNTDEGRFKNRRIEYKTATGGAPTATTGAATTGAANSAANAAK